MYFFINKVFKTTLVASHHSGAGPFPTAVAGGGQGTAGLRLEPQSKEGSPLHRPEEPPPLPSGRSPKSEHASPLWVLTTAHRLLLNHLPRKWPRSLWTAWLIRHEQ